MDTYIDNFQHNTQDRQTISVLHGLLHGAISGILVDHMHFDIVTLVVYDMLGASIIR